MRSMEEISREYQTQCAIAGDTQYKIEALRKDLHKMNMKLRELNREASKLKEAQDASAAVAKRVDVEVVSESGV